MNHINYMVISKQREEGEPIIRKQPVLKWTISNSLLKMRMHGETCLRVGLQLCSKEK